MYSIFEQLLKTRGITTYKVSKDTGIAQSVFSAWKSGVSQPKSDKIRILADYFSVSVDYFMGISEQTTPTLAALQTNDIAVDLDTIARKLSSTPDESGVFYKGKSIDSDTKEMISSTFRLAIKYLDMVSNLNFPHQ